MKKHLAAALVFLALAAPQARAGQVLDHGTFTRSCAPWDGAAVRFGIGTADGAAYPQIGISIYKGADKIRTGTFPVPFPFHDGNVNYCTDNAKCQLAKGGQIEIIEFTPWATAHIKYDITLDDGTELKGEAALTGSNEKTLCG